MKSHRPIQSCAIAALLAASIVAGRVILTPVLSQSEDVTKRN
jgi:hypothetical protein